MTVALGEGDLEPIEELNASAIRLVDVAPEPRSSAPGGFSPPPPEGGLSFPSGAFELEPLEPLPPGSRTPHEESDPSARRHQLPTPISESAPLELMDNKPPKVEPREEAAPALPAEAPSLAPKAPKAPMGADTTPLQAGSQPFSAGRLAPSPAPPRLTAAQALAEQLRRPLVKGIAAGVLLVIAAISLYISFGGKKEAGKPKKKPPESFEVPKELEQDDSNLRAREVQIIFDVSPRSAKMLIDGRVVPVHSLLAPDDEKPITVRFEAKGYEPVELKVIPNQNRRKSVALVKLPEPDPPPRKRRRRRRR